LSRKTSTHWDPGTYNRFRDFRLRPALDLLAALGPLPQAEVQGPEQRAGTVLDLGCGSGNAAPALKSRFPTAMLLGLDSSARMLEGARTSGCYDALHEGDIASWTPDTALSVIFSNAALNWLPDHARLLPALVQWLRPGGVLAVQVPDQALAPSHQLWHQLSESLWPARFDWSGWAPHVLAPEDYVSILSPLGDLSLWRSEYFQILPAERAAHPVRQFTQSTFARPVLDALSAAEQAQICAAYDAAAGAEYPLRADGSVLFPFRRLFFTLTRPAPV
jgi:trans-aconitate 2-methyltransferase